MRVGIGYDIHPLKKDKMLILGGVKIPYMMGLSGHSDGDVLLHSIIDSIFGAFGLPDIGNQFPDNDPKYKNISSIRLLEKTMNIVKGCIVNIDSTILCEEPKLSPYISDMKSNIATVTGITPSYISIKATTGEKMGVIGKKKAIASYAVVLCEEI